MSVWKGRNEGLGDLFVQQQSSWPSTASTLPELALEFTAWLPEAALDVVLETGYLDRAQ
jgi:hypothetical protein